MSPNNKYKAPICPDCKIPMALRNGKFGKFYGCKNFPSCRSIVGAHQKDGAPLGIPADQATRTLRIKAHDLFDREWKAETDRARQCDLRREMYVWMADALDLPEDKAHIGMLEKADLEKLIFLLEKKCETQKATTGKENSSEGMVT